MRDMSDDEIAEAMARVTRLKLQLGDQIISIVENMLARQLSSGVFPLTYRDPASGSEQDFGIVIMPTSHARRTANAPSSDKIQ